MMNDLFAWLDLEDFDHDPETEASAADWRDMRIQEHDDKQTEASHREGASHAELKVSW